MAQVHGVHGVATTDTFLVNLFLPNKVIFSGVRVTKGDIGDADILIGMDIISQGDFAVTNEGGITKFSFRTPSIKHIDYVEEAKANSRLQTPKPPEAPVPSRADRRRARFGR